MDIVYKLWIYAVLPFLISFFSAWVFWILTFKYSNINVVFSEKLEKRLREREDGGKEFLYRIRLSNTGRRDLIEVSLIAKVTVRLEDNKIYATHFPVGDKCVNPVIRKMKSNREVARDGNYYPHIQTKIPQNYKLQFYGIYIDDIGYKEFAKEEYAEEIREKARAKTLVLDDIFEVYPNARLVIYVFGNDSVTGARRKYESKEYSKEDIVKGTFNGFYDKAEDHEKLRRARGKKKIEILTDMLSAIEKE